MNVNLYLPDDLGQRAKDADLPLSQLLRAAVVDELHRRRAMASTTQQMTEHELTIENDDGATYTATVVGTLIGENDRNGDKVFLTGQENVVAYDEAKLRYHVLENPEEELRHWLPDDGVYVAAMSALGLNAKVDLDL